MSYNLISPSIRESEKVSEWDIRFLACAVQWNNRTLPDKMEDVDLPLAISILQENGFNVQPAK